MRGLKKEPIAAPFSGRGMPDLPPLGLNIDRCITKTRKLL